MEQIRKGNKVGWGEVRINQCVDSLISLPADMLGLSVESHCRIDLSASWSTGRAMRKSSLGICGGRGRKKVGGSA